MQQQPQPAMLGPNIPQELSQEQQQQNAFAEDEDQAEDNASAAGSNLRDRTMNHSPDNRADSLQMAPMPTGLDRVKMRQQKQQNPKRD